MSWYQVRQWQLISTVNRLLSANPYFSNMRFLCHRKEEESPQVVLQHHAAPGREPQGLEEDHRGRGEEQRAQHAAAAAWQPASQPSHLPIRWYPGHPGRGGGRWASVAGRRRKEQIFKKKKKERRGSIPQPPFTNVNRHEKYTSRQLTNAHKNMLCSLPVSLSHILKDSLCRHSDA